MNEVASGFWCNWGSVPEVATAVVAAFHALVIAIAAYVAWMLAKERERIAKRSLRYERFHQASRLLGDPAVVARLSGANALWRLARSYPSSHHSMVMDAFAAYLSYPASFPESHPQHRQHDPDSPETVRILRMINHEKTPAQKNAEQNDDYRLRLADASPYEVIEHNRVQPKGT